MKSVYRLLPALCGIFALFASFTEAEGSTSPVGFVSYSFPASASGTTFYMSAPLLAAVAFSGTPTAVGTNTITVGSASWTASQFIQNNPNTRPYYVLIKTGSEAGRALLITANTATQLTVDTSDGSNQSTDLTTSGFALGTSDGIEISAGNTLRSLFGDGGSFPGAGDSLDSAGGVGIWNSKLQAFDYYYQSTTEEQWVKVGADSSKDAGDTVIPPGATIAILFPAGYAGGRLIVTGRPITVAPLLKTTGNNAIRYYGLQIPVDMSFSQLNFGSSWTKNDSILQADTLSIYNSTLSKWESFYQNSSGTWLKAGTGSSQNSTVIKAGSAVAFLKRSAVSGGSSFLPVPLPYTP